MKITYTLNNLIVFWHYIRQENYKTITQILNLIDDNDIPDEDKREIILELLRGAGLYESGYTPEGEIIESEEFKKDQVLVPIDAFKLQILNTTANAYIVLN